MSCAQSASAAGTASSSDAPATRRIASPKDSPPSPAARSMASKRSMQTAELPAIDFDPAAADQLQAVHPFEQRLDLGRAQALAVERELHVEIEQRVHPERGRRTGADDGSCLWSRRPAGLPVSRRAHHDPGRLELVMVLEQAPRVCRRPAQRVIDLARVDHLAQPVALLGGALHRQQQRQQLRFAPAIRVFRQRVLERQVLGLAVRRQARRVGRHERERRLRVLAVLRQVEVHASDQIPRRMARLEKLLQRLPGGRQFAAQSAVELSPQRDQDLPREVFRARHRRHVGNHRLERGGIGRTDRDGPVGGGRAQRGHVTRSKLAPPRERRGQDGADFRCAQVQQPVPGAGFEGRCDAIVKLGRQWGQRCVRLQSEMAVRGH